MTRFLQFGTSRFLQAHADLFIGEALGQDQVTVVHSSGNASTLGRLEALQSKEGFPVIIRGLEAGLAVERSHTVHSIASALSAASDWNAVLKLGARCDFIISNVSEKGYIPNKVDSARDFSAAKSFPAKLLHLLTYRFSQGASPPTIMPMELFEANGDRLKSLVLKLAREWQSTAEMQDWLEQCTWVNSLVDRIVSEPIEPAGAIAEPYGLWAVEKVDGLDFPIKHQAIKLVNDLRPYQCLKLYILNLSHT